MGDSIVVLRFVDYELPDVLNPLRKHLSLYNCTLNLTSIEYVNFSHRTTGKTYQLHLISTSSLTEKLFMYLFVHPKNTHAPHLKNGWRRIVFFLRPGWASAVFWWLPSVFFHEKIWWILPDLFFYCSCSNLKDFRIQDREMMYDCWMMHGELMMTAGLVKHVWMLNDANGASFHRDQEVKIQILSKL